MSYGTHALSDSLKPRAWLAPHTLHTAQTAVGRALESDACSQNQFYFQPSANVGYEYRPTRFSDGLNQTASCPLRTNGSFTCATSTSLPRSNTLAVSPSKVLAHGRWRWIVLSWVKSTPAGGDAFAGIGHHFHAVAQDAAFFQQEAHLFHVHALFFQRHQRDFADEIAGFVF